MGNSRCSGHAKHLQGRGPGIDGRNTRGQLVGAVHVRAIEPVISAAFALVKHNVKERGEGRIRATVEPDFDRIQIGRIAKHLLLLWWSQRDVSASPVSTPAFNARTDTESRVSKSDALINFVFIRIPW